MAATEPDDDSEEPGFREPLPQDDRLWRHPSELGALPRRRSGVGKLLSTLLPRQRP